MGYHTSGIDGRASHGAAADETARFRRLNDQMEELVLQVWACEKEWRLDDRIDLALGVRRCPTT
jgi:hypothetical protein